MEPNLLAIAREIAGDYWPHVSGLAIAAIGAAGTAIFFLYPSTEIIGGRNRSVLYRIRTSCTASHKARVQR